ncbi:MAG TPA: carboxypeptidase-like regulatory domain-containing protein [Acidobacteriaceae bacterium]|nr:carboxypeptidase-like regulatory domain-containing protein [Acidobacteriaceae bacterium]
MHLLATVPLCLALLSAPLYALGQAPPASTPKIAMINGVVTDQDGDLIPGAAVSIVGSKNKYKSSATADANGRFTFDHLDAANTYRLTITAPGFSEWKSAEIALQPGQHLDLNDITMKISAVETSVSAVFADQVATQQVKGEETQRVLGVVPSFFVVYAKNPVPMRASLKFNLAIRAETDSVTFFGAALLAGIHQAGGGSPHYQQGLKGYGQRYGAAYAGGVSDILIGGAILPSLLHQDPRYFYSGEGTRKQRVAHALRAVFLTHGDNGKTEFNYSGLGGDMASAALANAYYPSVDRGAHLFFANWAVLMGGRAANTLAQEFLSRLTTHPNAQ